MAENTKIEWCDDSFNPWRGCTRISPGCANCYADKLSERNPTSLGIWGPQGTRIVASQSMWQQPLIWNREQYRECSRCHWRGPTDCQKCQLVWSEMIPVRRRVFCASLGDVFEDWTKEMRYPAYIKETKKLTTQYAWWRPDKGIVKPGQTTVNLPPVCRPATMQDARNQLFKLIEATPNLDWLLLTKRPENVLRMVPAHWLTQFPANVWMGTSTENQAMADKRIPELLKIPAAVRFLSCEPLLEKVNLSLEYNPQVEANTIHSGIHWVIVGGESGPGARPMHPDWALEIQGQCEITSTPFLFKQWGNWFPRSQWEFNPDIVLPDDSDNHRLYYLENEFFHNIGKLKAGRLLHGHEHNGYPKSHLPTP